MSEKVNCAKCATEIHWLEVFPDNYCLACHAEREEGRPLPSAEEIRKMFRNSVNL